MTKGAYRLVFAARISGVFEYNESRTAFYGRQLETAASHYETRSYVRRFHALVDYVNEGNSATDFAGASGRRILPPSSCRYPVRGILLAKRSSAPTLCSADVAMGVC